MRAPLLISALLTLILSAPAQAPATYDEPYRPQVHFSPQRNWTNDPNGLVYFNGEYHLFFQYNPFGDQWGHMSWGHAVSNDLLHWRELPVAIPEQTEAQGTEMVFTGSVVVDEQNTSGLCTNGKPCMVAVYTGHHTNKPTQQNQNLAYSNDNGRTWTRYVGNPVLDLHLSDFRDPGVFRDEGGHRWLMAVALPLEHKVRFYASVNLKQWTQLSEFGPAGDVAGDWECPNLLRVPADKGGPAIWALKVGLNPGAPEGGSGEQYFLGSFASDHFTAASRPGAHGWSNYGKDDYCAISFNHLPTGSRPTLLGWMNNWQYAGKLPTSPWRGQMSLPRRLSYVNDAGGLALKQEPVIAPLRGDHITITSSNSPQELKFDAPFELSLAFDHADQGTVGLRLYTDDEHWTEVAFDRTKQEFSIDRTHAGVDVTPDFPVKTVTTMHKGRPCDLRLIVDRSSVEAFAQNGTIAMTNLIFPATTHNRLVFFSSTNGKVAVKGDAWTLRSIWK